MFFKIITAFSSSLVSSIYWLICCSSSVFVSTIIFPKFSFSSIIASSAPTCNVSSLYVNSGIFLSIYFATSFTFRLVLYTVANDDITPIINTYVIKYIIALPNPSADNSGYFSIFVIEKEYRKDDE